ACSKSRSRPKAASHPATEAAGGITAEIMGRNSVSSQVFCTASNALHTVCVCQFGPDFIAILRRRGAHRPVSCPRSALVIVRESPANEEPLPRPQPCFFVR